MLFNSYQFMLFFPVVLLIYFIIPKKIRYIWLLLASYVFYMGWNAKYALLILGVTAVTYAGGLLISRIDDRKWKKGAMVASVVICIGVLFFFKYYDFGIANLNKLLSMAGMEGVSSPFSLVLPVGISFYTFQALSYTIDVYRGETEAESNFLRYALFVSFFPQLVAGPIERSNHLLKQLRNVENIKLWNYKNVTEGTTLMLWGYFLKMVIADRAALFVDTVYNEWWTFGTVELILATILFAIQIYCDFNSYSLIAIGAAKIMGFDLMWNFDAPYFSHSIRDFWRRWHISLSLWLRDYLYIPLGGSRCSKPRKWFNIMLTFLASGLWHGAAWHYVVWGGLHGVYQVAEDMLHPVVEKVETCLQGTSSVSYKVSKILLTDALVCFAWLFFRAGSLSDAFGIMRRTVTCFNPWVLTDGSLYGYGLDIKDWHILLVALLTLLLADIVQYRKKMLVAEAIRGQVIWFRWIFLFGLFFAIFVTGIYGSSYDAADFIYFQF